MKPEQTTVKKIPAIKSVFFAAYGLFAVSVAMATLYFISLSYHHGPFRDMWIAMDFIRACFENTFVPADLFVTHGGAHRLLIPRLFFLVDYGVFSGSNVFLIVSSLLVQLSVVGLIWNLLKQETHIPERYRWFLAAVTLVLMFNATQLENFIYTFDMQWFVTSAAAIWALYFWNRLFGDIAGQHFFSARIFAFALLLTAVAMFSSFSGLCVLLVLPPLLLVYRLPFRQVFIATGFVVLVMTCYMSGSFGVGTAHVSAGVETGMSGYVRLVLHIVSLWAKWIALYFGSPLGRQYFWPGALVAYGSLLFILWNWFCALRKNAEPFTSLQIFALSLALFAAIVGMSTGLGRMYFVNTADEDRYQSIVLVYWLGVFVFALSRALQIEVRQQISCYRYGCMAGIIFWTGFVIPLASIKDAQAQVDFFDRVNNANLAIATGQWGYEHIKDTLILGDKWKKINRPEIHASFLREKKWGIYASAEVALLGSTLDSHFISADRCEGDIDTLMAVSAPYHGYRITGHGQDVRHGTLPGAYVAIDETGRVVGLGRLQRQKNSLRPLTWQPTEQAHWLLYTQNLVVTSSLQILGKLADGGYCVMASAKLPSLTR